MSIRHESLSRLRSVLLAGTVLAGAPMGAMAQDAVADLAELEEIVVKGSIYETESSDSYTTDLISVGDKDVRSVREVPQSATVLTRERLEDGNYTSLDTALKEAPGVVVLSNDDGRSSLYSRGFEFDYINLNGLPTPVSSIYGTQPDMAVVDHIEILRGPAGLFGGAGEPGGAVNVRLKQARDSFAAKFATVFGTEGEARIEGDITGALNAEGTVRGRIVGALGTKDGFVDINSNKSAVLYGTLQADITPNTTATVSINHQRRHIQPFNGLPALADGTLLDLDRSTTTGAEWNDFNNSVTDYIGELEHRFETGGHAKVSGRYSVTDVNFLYGFAGSPAQPDGTVSGLQYLSRIYEERSVALDAHISKPFDINGIENNIIVGADYRRSDTSMRNQAGKLPATLYICNWDTSAIAPPVVNYTVQDETTPTQYGIYGQWRVKPFDALTLIAGGRISWYEAGSSKTTLATGVKTPGDAVSYSGQFTPYAGVIYDLTDRVSAYGSYTEIFQPQSVFDSANKLLPARTGRQYEVGLKAEVFDNVNASIAYFDLRDNNRAVPDPANPGSSAALGEAHLSGLELEASGTVLPGLGLEVAAGYTYTRTEFLNTAAVRGSEFYTPEHMLQVRGKYSLDESAGALDGAFIGAGLKVFSSFKNIVRLPTGAVFDVKAPGYAVVDVFAGYKFNENVTASLSVNNVFDAKYYERVGTNQFFNFYGAPRSFTFKLATSF